MDVIKEAFQASMPASHLALVLVIAVLSQWVAWALKVPSILLLLVSGFVLGLAYDARDVLGEDLLYAGTSIAVGVILFEGGLSLKRSELSGVSKSVQRLCTVTVALAWVFISLAAWVAGVDPRLAVLIGALLVVTGPTVINPIVRQIRPTKRVSAMLRWEGIVVDPIGAVLATLVFKAITASGDSLLVVIGGLALTIAVGFGLAIPTGWVLGFILRRHGMPDHLQGVAFLAIAVGVFVASNAIQTESGLVTVTILGVYLANQPGIKLNGVREFKEHLQVLFVGSLFVLLAGLISMDQLIDVLPTAAIFIPLLILVARPLSIFGGLAGTDSQLRERMLLAFMAPRGIVAAAVTSIFAIEMEHLAHNAEEKLLQLGENAEPEEVAAATARYNDLHGLAENAANLVPLVFFVVVVTVAVYGLGVGRLAERLGLASTSPQGVLFAGASGWAIQAAERLRELDVQVMLISMNYRWVLRARTLELPVEYSHILSDYVLYDLDTAGLGYVISATDDDETNATAAREFGHSFGSQAAFQLQRRKTKAAKKKNKNTAKREAGSHLDSRTPFAPATSFDELERRLSAGASVRTVHLGGDFTREDFQDKYGDEAVVMFTVIDGKVSVFTEKSDLPQKPCAVVALLPKEPEKPERSEKTDVERADEERKRDEVEMTEKKRREPVPTDEVKAGAATPEAAKTVSEPSSGSKDDGKKDSQRGVAQSKGSGSAASSAASSGDDGAVHEPEPRSKDKALGLPDKEPKEGKKSSAEDKSAPEEELFEG